MKDIQKLIRDAERADAVAALMQDVNPHTVLALVDRLKAAGAQLAELAKQEPSGWYAVENAIRDLGEPLYLDGRHKPSGWNSDYKPLYARAAPPAPVKLPRGHILDCFGRLETDDDGVWLHKDDVIEALKAADMEVADE
ncbi:hypothetical protein [Mixta gaviniae]|uniref:Uncharacterized protein n=1 Tax=Mixta gaviniae TaxID=665914 RepID=A0A1X1EEG4_9GAMM|nr:hypothetical protein [Mixta gaviniae]AUX94274.1 hypothetical protein C2E15_15125 [Mixta gaviniae]ORM87348.1 hypothetical protein HA44_01460 [Mixta gaviniae]